MSITKYMYFERKIKNYVGNHQSGAMEKYLEEGYNKNEYIFFKSTRSWWSVGFTKPMISYEILAISGYKTDDTKYTQLMIQNSQTDSTSTQNWWCTMALTDQLSLGNYKNIIDRDQNFEFCTSDIPTG